MNQLIHHDNIALLWTRPMSPKYDFSVFCSSVAVDQSAAGNKSVGAGGTYVGPLFDYSPRSGDGTLDYEADYCRSGQDGRSPNLDPAFLRLLEDRMGKRFLREGEQQAEDESFTAYDVFHYVYATLSSGAYCARYSHFLKVYLPRVPLPLTPELFHELCRYGKELVDLHLLRAVCPNVVTLRGRGSCLIDRVRYDADDERVWINDAQYFEGVSGTVWAKRIGGYAVCEKWLKELRGAELSEDQTKTFCQVASALESAEGVLTAIDDCIAERGDWLDAFVAEASEDEKDQPQLPFA